MENHPSIDEIGKALAEHFKEVILPSGAAKKIVERVRNGGPERAIINDVELMLMEFLALAAKKKETAKEVVEKLKNK